MPRLARAGLLATWGVLWLTVEALTVHKVEYVMIELAALCTIFVTIAVEVGRHLSYSLPRAPF